MTKQEKLRLWQERFARAEEAMQGERERMRRREMLYEGDHAVKSRDGQWRSGEALYVRNVALELIESQVDSSVPAPRVTALRSEDVPLAETIEDMLRDVMDRQPMERINDLAERICPVQGGHGLLADWDALTGRGGAAGELKLTLLHPSQMLPQPGVTEPDAMDYLFLETPITRDALRAAYGSAVAEDCADAPGAAENDEVLTLRTVFYRGENGIGRFRWVRDTVAEDIEGYQQRRVFTCRCCGAEGDGTLCTACGGTDWDSTVRGWRTLTQDYVTANGRVIPALSPARGELGQILTRRIGPERITDIVGNGNGEHPNVILSAREEVVTEPTRIPFYQPDCFPVVLRRNVSRFGRFFGASDIDAIEDQQNALNKLCTKMQNKVLGGGSFVTVPKGARLAVDDRDNRVLELDDPKAKQLIDVYNTQVDISADLALSNQIYEHARQIIGITDSFQGRRDETAVSAVAKQFAAERAAGRMESKAVMKRAMYADLFELIFKFMLAFCDAPCAVRRRECGSGGETLYRIFDPMDFLYRDEAGAWHYNTDFLFSAESASALAGDRSAMWQETRRNYESGAMGDPSSPEAREKFWTLMEQLHYPMAGVIKGE